MWWHSNGRKSELMISLLTAPLWIYPFVPCFSALLPSLCVFSFLLFSSFPICFLSLSSFSLLRGETKLADRVHELICLFIFIYWDIKHWWSPIIPPLLPVSVPMLWRNLDTVPQRKTEMNFETYWIFSQHISKVCLLCPQDSVWQNISHATNTLKVLRTSRWQQTIQRTPGKNVLSIIVFFWLRVLIANMRKGTNQAVRSQECVIPKCGQRTRLLSCCWA